MKKNEKKIIHGIERNMMQHLTKSKRVGAKIIIDGYGYNFKERKGNIMLWICSKRNCTGFLKTTIEYIYISKPFYTQPGCSDNFYNQNVMVTMQKGAGYHG